MSSASLRITTPSEAGTVFAQTRPKLAAYTHLVFLSSKTVPCATIEDLVAQTRLTYDGPLEVGQDLTRFEVGPQVSVGRLT